MPLHVGPRVLYCKVAAPVEDPTAQLTPKEPTAIPLPMKPTTYPTPEDPTVTLLLEALQLIDSLWAQGQPWPLVEWHELP